MFTLEERIHIADGLQAELTAAFPHWSVQRPVSTVVRMYARQGDGQVSIWVKADELDMAASRVQPDRQTIDRTMDYADPGCFRQLGLIIREHFGLQ